MIETRDALACAQADYQNKFKIHKACLESSQKVEATLLTSEAKLKVLESADKWELTSEEGERYLAALVALDALQAEDKRLKAALKHGANSLALARVRLADAKEKFESAKDVAKLLSDFIADYQFEFVKYSYHEHIEALV